MYEYEAQLLRVIDGDTLVVNIDLGFDITTRQTIRLVGINAPEIHSKNSTEKMMGLRARDRLSELLDHGTVGFKIATTKGNDKYGRYLASVVVSSKVDDTYFSVADILLEEKLVFVYDGKTKIGNLNDLKPL